MLKKTKPIISVLAIAAVLFAFAACTQNNSATLSPSPSSPASPSGAPSTSSAAPSEDELWKKEAAYGTTITVGYDGGVCTSPVVMANILGYYKEEGIEVTVVGMGNNTAEAIGTGKVTVGTDHIAYLMVPCVNGVDIIFTTASQVGCKSLYVLKDSGIEKTSDLKGKNVAIPAGYGSFDHNIALRFFQKDGIGTNEVNYKVVESGAAILAMQNGEIDGAILSDQYSYNFVKDGTLKYVRSLTWDEDFSKDVCCVVAFSKTFYEKNPITTLKMTRAVLKAKNWINANPAEAAKVMLDNNITSGDADIIADLISAYNFAITDQQCEVTLRSIIKDYKIFGLIEDSADTEEIMKNLWHPLLQG